MAKGKIITPEEKERIKELFSTIKTIRGTARAARRDPAAVRKIVREKPSPDYFSWKNYNGKVI